MRRQESYHAALRRVRMSSKDAENAMQLGPIVKEVCMQGTREWVGLDDIVG